MILLATFTRPKHSPDFGSGLAFEEPIDHPGQSRANHGCDPEQPQLGQRLAFAGHRQHQRGSGAASRVHRGIGHRDGDQVYQGKGQADRETPSTAVPRLSVTPRMMNRNINIMTTSVT